MSEFRRAIRNVSAVVALGIGFAACGGGSINDVEAAPRPNLSGIEREVIYYHDGTRIIKFEGDFEGSFHQQPPTLLQFCDTDGSFNQVALGNPAHPGGIVRIENSLKCADGMLTLEDFALPTK